MSSDPCVCNLAALYESILEGPEHDFEDLAKNAMQCKAEIHKHNVRTKDKIYMIAHSKKFEYIQRAMNTGFLSFDDYAFAIDFYGCYEHLSELYLFKKKEYLDWVKSCIPDDILHLKILLPPMKKEQNSYLVTQ